MASFTMKAAAIYAATNAATIAPIAAVTSGLMVSLSDLKDMAGPSGIAVAAALLGVIARWLYFRIPKHIIWREFIASPIMAFVFASSWPPVLQSYLGAVGPDGPQVMGFVIGMFGPLVVGFFNDFLSSVRARKKGEQA